MKILTLDEISEIAFRNKLTQEEAMSMYISHLADVMTFETAWRIALMVIGVAEVIKIIRGLE